MKYKLLISYEGTAYSGWQLQPHASSIQGELERVLTQVLRHPCRPVGAGRTDAGVHAYGQVAHFSLPHACDTHKLLYALNGLLAPDIRVLEVTAVEDSFHAQYSAQRKIYRYQIWQHPIVDPFIRNRIYHYTYPLSLSVLETALPLLEGTHDFAAFANHTDREGATERTLYRITAQPTEGGFFLFFEGNGFLYKMVRNLVGLLLDIGRGKRPTSDIPLLFAAKERRLASAAAPASGLSLMQVIY